MSRAATRAWWLAGVLCVAVVIVDQIVKAVIEDRIVLGEKVDLLGPLKLTLSHNEGVAFGLAGGSGAPLVIVTVLALGVVLYLFSRNPARPLMWIATGLLAGGAVGNLIDRIRAGAVTDFIELPHWPPFNLADCAISVGVVLLVLIYLREAERAPESG
ncbi:MAG TPA: signal peptidase II [Solirubrobacterales bacterium]|nr:signal peptidase II [Solirubrobacterales bacterium]